MRTYNIKFDDNKTANRFHFNTDNDGFRFLRRVIFTEIARVMLPIFTHRIADICDVIKDMAVGASIYVVASKYEPYSASNIISFNRTIAMMEQAARENLGENYMPEEFTAFRIKRTSKMWKMEKLDGITY